MAKYYGKNGKRTKAKTLVKPEDYEAEFKCNIALFDMDTIEDIVKECKPYAKGSEFQVHYHSLQAHISNGDYEVCITLPLSFYNFEQEVTSGSVEFEMKDENKESALSAKLNQEKLDELFNKFPMIKHLEHLGYGVKYTVSNNGSIHRHPGDFSFSSIDYDKDPKEPGVIYRQLRAKDLYQTDSVIYLGESEPKFVCTETRIVNVEPVENNGGIKGKYTEIPTMSFIKKRKKPKNKMYEILGVEEDSSNELLKQFKSTTSMNMPFKEYPLLVGILEAYLESDYKPDISNIKGERIKDKYTKNKVGYSFPKKNHSQKDYCSYLGWDDEDCGWEDYVEKEYQMLQKEQEPETITVYGQEKIWNEEWQCWLDPKCADMSEAELIQYLDEQGYA